MDLCQELNTLPLLRPLAVPLSQANICLIILKADLPDLKQFLDKYPQLRLHGMVIPDLPFHAAKRIRLTIGDEIVKVLDFNCLGEYPQFEKVFFYTNRHGYIAAILSQLCIHLSSMFVSTIWLAGPNAPEHGIRKAIPDFFAQNAEKLARAQSLFADDFSKRTFAGRLKALITGNAGYIPVASHREYFHPLVQPTEGSIMIDGGVSDLVENQISFAEAVGSGRIFGFEPVPEMAESAARQLANWPVYEIHAAGLAREEGTAVFDNLRDSSHIAKKDKPGTGQIVCGLTSIDAFCRKNHIERIDCIKLDVEGSELAALQGAEQTIRKNRPKLIICLYHKPVDMYEIPCWIKQVEPAYELYLAHSSCQFMDTVLYARCKS